jgi:hypothetical protein
MVINRLDNGAQAPGFDTWQNCRDGLSCDWYYISLLQNQRLSATTYDVTDDLCNIELAVYLDPAAEFYGDAESPALFDQGGSMAQGGAQLSFVAPVSGVYRIGVRANGTWNCPRYAMTVARGPADVKGPRPYH